MGQPQMPFCLPSMEVNMLEFTTLDIILMLLGLSAALQALIVGLIFVAMKRAKAAILAVGGILELDA